MFVQAASSFSFGRGRLAQQQQIRYEKDGGGAPTAPSTHGTASVWLYRLYLVQIGFQINTSHQTDVVADETETLARSRALKSGFIHFFIWNSIFLL